MQGKEMQSTTSVKVRIKAGMNAWARGGATALLLAAPPATALAFVDVFVEFEGGRLHLTYVCRLTAYSAPCNCAVADAAIEKELRNSLFCWHAEGDRLVFTNPRRTISVPKAVIKVRFRKDNIPIPNPDAGRCELVGGPASGLNHSA